LHNDPHIYGLETIPPTLPEEIWFNTGFASGGVMTPTAPQAFDLELCVMLCLIQCWLIKHIWDAPKPDRMQIAKTLAQILKIVVQILICIEIWKNLT
jgi:hypothetical protein